MYIYIYVCVYIYCDLNSCCIPFGIPMVFWSSACIMFLVRKLSADPMSAGIHRLRESRVVRWVRVRLLLKPLVAPATIATGLLPGVWPLLLVSDLCAFASKTVWVLQQKTVQCSGAFWRGNMWWTGILTGVQDSDLDIAAVFTEESAVPFTLVGGAPVLDLLRLEHPGQFSWDDDNIWWRRRDPSRSWHEPCHIGPDVRPIERWHANIPAEGGAFDDCLAEDEDSRVSDEVNP